MRKPLWEEKSKQCLDYLLTKSHADKRCQKSHYKEIPAKEWSFICVHGSENIQYMIRAYGYTYMYLWWVDSPFLAILFIYTSNYEVHMVLPENYDLSTLTSHKSLLKPSPTYFRAPLTMLYYTPIF